MIAIVGAIAEQADDRRVLATVSDCLQAAHQRRSAGVVDLARRGWLSQKVRLEIFSLEWCEQLGCFVLGGAARQALAGRVEWPRGALLQSGMEPGWRSHRPVSTPGCPPGKRFLDHDARWRLRASNPASTVATAIANTSMPTRQSRRVPLVYAGPAWSVHAQR